MNVIEMPRRDNLAEAQFVLALLISVLTPIVDTGLHVSDELAASILDELKEARKLIADEGPVA